MEEKTNKNKRERLRKKSQKIKEFRQIGGIQF